MFKNFIKYQSLGNDFILFDGFKKPETFITQELNHPSWSSFVQNICNRHTGIGADGVLILKDNHHSSLAEMLIFNADGTQAELCLNGLRCIAHFLTTHYQFESNFSILTLAGIINCTMVHDKNHPATLLITTQLKQAQYQSTKTLTIDEKQLIGHSTNVGNPHFIIFEPTTFTWLTQHGKNIESHPEFPQKTNVEFIWSIPNKPHHYNMLVYERGCGITMGCSSGASAVTWTLFTQQLIKAEQQITLMMPGGSVICWIDQQHNINLQAEAHMIFTGTLS
jgi:diaminopimelate epimerase